MSAPEGDPMETGVTPRRSSQALSEFEFMLTVLMFGFQRWIEHCMDVSGARGLAAIDILTLHAVNRRARRRRIADICMIMNIHETHLVSYSLKKLVAAGLVDVQAAGRERFYETTTAGDEVCRTYLELREKVLVSNVMRVVPEEHEFHLGMSLLGQMIALYDQASRVVVAENPPQTLPPRVRTKR